MLFEPSRVHECVRVRVRGGVRVHVTKVSAHSTGRARTFGSGYLRSLRTFAVVASRIQCTPPRKSWFERYLGSFACLRMAAKILRIPTGPATLATNIGNVPPLSV